MHMKGYLSYLQKKLNQRQSPYNLSHKITLINYKVKRQTGTFCSTNINY